MTQLYIDGHLCDLPTDFKITLVTENLYFSKASTYTYDVKLPMLPFSNNAKIFGHLNRFDKSLSTRSWPAQLIVDNKVIVNGTAVVVGITEADISVQLLQGRSKENWKNKYDKVYIDELELGDITQWGLKWEDGKAQIDGSKVEPTEVGTQSSVNHGFYWTQKNYSDYTNGNVVLTPIINHDTGEIMNPIGPADEFTTRLVFCLRDPEVFWPTGHPYYILPARLAPQPKLKIMVNKVFEVLGLNIVLNELENITFYNNLIIANSTEVQYIADVLPHITFIEFVELLQNLFNCVVDINEEQTSIYLRKNIYSDTATNETIENVVDEYQREVDNEKTVSDSDKAKVYDIAYPDYGVEFLGEDFKTVPIITDANKLTNVGNPYIFGRNVERNIKVSSPYASNSKIYGNAIDRWEPSNDLEEKVTLKFVPLMNFEEELIDEHHYFYIQNGDLQITGHLYADVKIKIAEAFGHNTQNNGQNIQELLDELETPEGRITIDKVCLGFLSKNFAFDEPPTLGTHDATYDILTSMFKAKLESQLNPDQYITGSEQPYDMTLRKRLYTTLTPVQNFYHLFYKDTTEIETSVITDINFVPKTKTFNVLHAFLIKNQLFACKQIKYSITARGFEKIAEGEFYKL